MTALSVEYSGLGRALHDLGYAQDAAEYHGTLCGMLCVHQKLPEDLGLSGEHVPEASDEAMASAKDQLADLHTETLASLRDPEMDFSPLLPTDDDALSERVDALGLWCQGFLLGLSSQPALDLNAASSELREAVEDLIQISHAQLGSEEEAEEDRLEDDETAYVELLEYVRTAVQLVFLELNPGAPPEADEYSGATVH